MLNRHSIIYIFLIIISIASISATLIILSNYLESENPPIIETKPEDGSINCNCEYKLNTNQTNKNKAYYNDTIFLITKSRPRMVLVATASRTQNKNDTYTQNTRISFFNGSDWIRKTLNENYETSNIYPNEIIQSWQIEIDDTKVLKQNVTGNIRIADIDIKFATDTLLNEMTMRSLPEYTKFQSESDANVNINGNYYKANVFYTRIYSNDQTEVLIYDRNVKFTTHWIAFWDTNGNFYHIDDTQVFSDTPGYTSHSIGYEKLSDGTIKQTFSLIPESEKDNPSTLTVIMGNNIDKTIIFNILNDFEKYPGIGYEWSMGYGEGTITDSLGNETSGYGISEYITN